MAVTAARSTPRARVCTAPPSPKQPQEGKRATGGRELGRAVTPHQPHPRVHAEGRWTDRRRRELGLQPHEGRHWGPFRGGCGRWPDDLEDVTAQDAQVLRPAGRKNPRHLPAGVSPHRPPVDGVLLKPLCLQGFHLDILKLLLQASGGDLFPGKVLLPKPSGPLCLSEHFTLNHIFHIILFHLSFCNVCLLYLSYCLSPFLSFFSFPPFSPISLLLHFNASLVNKVSCLCVLIQFESLCILVNKYPFTSILPSFFFLLTVIFLLFFLS